MSIQPSYPTSLRRRSAPYTVATAERILVAARSLKQVPAPVARSLARLAQVHKILDDIIATRAALGTSNHAEQWTADHQEDRAWSALHEFLHAVSRLPEGHPFAPRAKVVLDNLFKEGLAFTRIEYRAEWHEAERKIQMIVDEHLDKEIVKWCPLGGK